MEGREISILNLSEVLEENHTERIDSEYFKKKFLKDEGFMEKIGFKRTEEIGQVKGGKRLPLGETFSNSGIPYIRAEDVKDNFIEYENSPKISSELHETLKRYQTKFNDVLVTIVGNSIGDVGIVKFNIAKCNLTENCVKILSNTISADYLLVYLKSKYGQNLIEREKVGTAQPKLAIERINKFKIPILSSSFQLEISKIVADAYEKVNQSKQIYQQAENLLLEAVGLKDFAPSKEKTNVKSFKESFLAMERIDAEFYQQKYDDIESKIRRYKDGFTTVSHEYDHINAKSKIDRDAYNYIEIGDVNVGDGSAGYNLIETAELPANAKYEVKRGDLLISKVRPNRGAVTIIDFDAPNLIVSGAFCVLREKEDSVFSNETLKVLLRTKIYKEWLLKFNVGTQYPVIKDEDILTLPIPKIEQAIQQQISEKIRESQSLKKESENLLEIAKRAVEMAIEETEERAIEFINAENAETRTK